jgi:3D (Asp-Asp-Asp) domain-containing protein
MRLKQILFLVALCAMLFTYGWMSVETGKLEQECSRLEAEIELLQSENADLREQQAQLGRRMEAWLDEWAVDVWESSAYAPLDPRAKEGICYSGDPAVTASGAEVVPGVTAAAGPDVPFGTLVRIRGAGFREITDRGGRIRDGCIDLAVATREEALRWGRKNVKVVYRK